MSDGFASWVHRTSTPEASVRNADGRMELWREYAFTDRRTAEVGLFMNWGLAYDRDQVWQLWINPYAQPFEPTRFEYARLDGPHGPVWAVGCRYFLTEGEAKALLEAECLAEQMAR